FLGSVDPRSAGNGSLMRLAPIPLAYRANPGMAIHYAGESSRTTHGAPAFLSFTFAGLFLGTIVFASVADKFGRRVIFTYALLWYALATGIMAAQDWRGGILLWHSAVALHRRRRHRRRAGHHRHLHQ